MRNFTMGCNVDKEIEQNCFQNCLPDMAQLRKTLVPQLRNFCNSFAGKKTRLCASSFLPFQLLTFAWHKLAICKPNHVSCLFHKTSLFGLSFGLDSSHAEP